MKETSKKVMDQVLYILETYPASRNSDKLLQALLWKEFYNLRYNKEKDIYYIGVLKGKNLLSEFENLPLGETIKRHRAHIQNDLLKFLPTSFEVAKQRRIKEEVIRKYYAKNG